MPAVTVIVPIYDHWSSLDRCIAALRTHLDPLLHSVILVNDVGPHADTMEELILDAIDGAENIRYHRNPSNLGFVRTCNRAVFELDRTDNDVLLLNSDAELTAGALEEMQAVLHAAEHHGAVCARSDNASIATLPFTRRSSAPEELTQADSDAIRDAVVPLLPRYTIAPVAVGFAMMIRRSLIVNHGLFDEAYGTGYNEENDFCMRINALGYSSLFANRAYIRHLGSASFGEGKSELDRRNHELLMSRYPHYLDAVHSFLRFGYTAADTFAEVIADLPGVPRSVLIDLHHLSLVYNGSTRYALSFLRSLSELALGDDIVVTIAAQQGAIDFFDLEAYGFRVLPYGTLTEVFDLGLALAPVNNIRQLIQLNQHCARWVVSHFDMIASRAYELMLTDPLRPLVVERAMRYADRVVALSEFSVRDAAAFYPELADRLAERAEGVLLGSTHGAVVGEGIDRLTETPLETDVASAVAEGGYLLVMGNFYPHKQVRPAVEALAGTGHKIVAFGPVPGFEGSDDVQVLTSGVLSEAQLDLIFTRAALIVFPSAYEGFGLPIADAVDFGIPVLAFETEVAHELVNALGLGQAVRFFRRFDELPAAVDAALGDSRLRGAALELTGNVRNLQPYNDHLWQTVLDQLAQPVDPAALTARFDAIKGLERIESHGGDVHRIATELQQARRQSAEILASRTWRAGQRIARVGSPVLRVVRRSRPTR